MRDSVQRSNQDWLLLVGLFCFFFSGAAGLIYQVVWTRMLTQIFGNTTYAIATVLSAFMAGLAIGSYLFGQIAPGEIPGAGWRAVTLSGPRIASADAIV